LHKSTFFGTIGAVFDVLALWTGEMFWIDDVWVTGVLAARAGIKLISLNSFFTVYSEHLKCCLQNPLLECPYLVGPSDGEPQLIEQAANKSSICRRKDTKCRKRTSQEKEIFCTIREIF